MDTLYTFFQSTSRTYINGVAGVSSFMFYSIFKLFVWLARLIIACWEMVWRQAHTNTPLTNSHRSTKDDLCRILMKNSSTWPIYIVLSLAVLLFFSFTFAFFLTVENRFLIQPCFFYFNYNFPLHVIWYYTQWF